MRSVITAMLMKGRGILILPQYRWKDVQSDCECIVETSTMTNAQVSEL